MAGSDTSIDIAVIGAGPHALTLVTHLLQKRKHWHSRICIFDRSGQWMQRWHQQFSRLEIPHLRSPAVHHPDPNPFALRRFAENRAPELHPPYDLPGTQLFQEFCDRVIQYWQLHNHVVAADVVSLEPLNPGFRLWLSNGQTQTARRVVLAHGGSSKFLPPWVQQITPPYPPDRLQHSQDIDLQQVRCKGERILIIGSGLTSGHLAIGAIQRGATVTMMARRQFYEKLFDADPGWLGPKYLKGFSQESCWEKRWTSVMTARNGGSLTPAVMTQLRRFKADGKVTFREFCQVQTAAWMPQSDGPPDSQPSSHWQITCLEADRTLEAAHCDRIWLATGSTLHVQQQPLLQEMLTTHPIPQIHGLPVLTPNLSWGKQALYLMGGLAALQVGPTARNLSGARMASDRIVDGLLQP
ncbi:FAD/NAD(P)-binding protein [Alkalinema sp. FACHB-956]|uniref:FAD/NAD(P)-binding protein n=1 Tax=Alkalinema sp. FACHB-956 TaxID=2692768 RepID=UPI00168A2A78|nr:FAD/NAD(P)-binding protein [Alkalinema sp. FACHB-956]MBD2326082.1 SidA/IucD/PvdA family monooxygenase [Alkalinema sp. FACHB-956]